MNTELIIWASWVWVLVGCAGVIINGWVLWEAFRDLRWQRRNQINSVNEYITQTHVVQEALRTVIQTLILTGGIVRVGWFLPPRIVAFADQLAVGSLAIILISLLTISSGASHLVMRRAVMQQYKDAKFKETRQ